MDRKRHSAEEVVNKLRHAEVELGKGSPIASVCKLLGVTEQLYNRWPKEYGGQKSDEAKNLNELERENARLKRPLADAELDKAILKETASKLPSVRTDQTLSEPDGSGIGDQPSDSTPAEPQQSLHERAPSNAGACDLVPNSDRGSGGSNPRSRAAKRDA